MLDPLQLGPFALRLESLHFVSVGSFGLNQRFSLVLRLLIVNDIEYNPRHLFVVNLCGLFFLFTLVTIIGFFSAEAPHIARPSNGSHWLIHLS